MVKGARQSRTGFRGFGPPAAGWFSGFKREKVLRIDRPDSRKVLRFDSPYGAEVGGGALGAQILKKKGTAAAAGCVEWLCSLRSREKVLEMNPRWPDGAYVGKPLLFPQHIFYFVLWIERKWGNIVL